MVANSEKLSVERKVDLKVVMMAEMMVHLKVY